MALQLLVATQGKESISKALGEFADFAEIFPVTSELWGLSVATKYIDQVGEGNLLSRLKQFKLYSLYEGKWL
jgi:hypothetical protein